MNNRLKVFLSFYKPYRKLFAADLLTAAIAAGTAVLFPLCIRYITREPQNTQLIMYMGGALLLLILIQAGASYVYDYYGHAMGAMMERDMRNRLFAHYQRLSFSFYDRQKTGKLMTRITNDLLSLAELFHHAPEDYMIYAVKFFGSFAVMLAVNVRLSLTVLAFLPILGVFVMLGAKKLNYIYKRSYDKIADVNALVEENISGIRVVQGFTAEQGEIDRFEAENDRFLERRKDIYRNESIYMTVGIGIITQLILATVVVVGALAVGGSTLSLDVSDLLTFVLYVGNLTEPIIKLSHMTQQLQEGLAGFGRYMEIMSVQPEIADSPQAKDMLNMRGHVEFKSVSFRYDENGEFVLKDMSLDVKPGEYVAIVGASGAGKTTLCSLIPRFYDVSAGELLIDGANVRDITLASLRRNVGVVFQDVYLFAGTVKENILYGKPGASDDEIISAAKAANAHEFIMKLPNGYDTEVGHRGVRLSGGQKQRISIARVFLKNPPIIILDEATSALDNESERAVQASLERLAVDRTTFVIAHRLSTIENADRVIELK